jgi:hypothetical protein
MKITMLLPLADNHGTSFSEGKIEGILNSLVTQFHGCSTDGTVDGRSIDAGHRHRDISLRVTIVCERERLEEIRLRIVEIGRELGQISMYFEVRDYDGVQFLSTA